MVIYRLATKRANAHDFLGLFQNSSISRTTVSVYSCNITAVHKSQRLGRKNSQHARASLKNTTLKVSVISLDVWVLNVQWLVLNVSKVCDDPTTERTSKRFEWSEGKW